MVKVKAIVSVLTGVFLSVTALANGPTPSQVITKCAEVNDLVAQSAGTMTQAQRYAVLKLLSHVEAIALGQQPAPQPRNACAQENSAVMQPTFVKIKAFAYSTQGLNLNDSGATNFAAQWIQDYACASVDSYITDFKILKQFAYSTQGLNMNDAQSVEFAKNNIDRECQPGTNPQPEFQNFYKFAYSTQGMNMNETQARAYALQQIEAKYFGCPR